MTIRSNATTNDALLDLFGIRLKYVPGLWPLFVLDPECGHALVRAGLPEHQLEDVKDDIITRSLRWVAP